MKTTYAIAAIGCIFILAAGLMAGCTGTTDTALKNQTVQEQPANSTGNVTAPSQSQTPQAENNVLTQTLVLNSTSNNKIVVVPVGSRVLVRLSENPSTGYTWTATASKGLDIVSDTYTPPNSALVGSAGYRDWVLLPETVDTYTFSAVYLRSWEGATPEDESFKLVIQATKN